MMTRMKKRILTGVTKEQMEQAFSDYVTADARVAEIKANMEKKMTVLREKYADDLQKYSDLKNKSFHMMQVYATENKATLFNRKKSVKTIYGVFGFRTGTPKLKTMTNNTWGSVTSKLKDILPGYVRVYEEPAKDMLLGERNNPKIAGLFGEIGIYVDRDECFYVERKNENIG